MTDLHHLGHAAARAAHLEARRQPVQGGQVAGRGRQRVGDEVQAAQPGQARQHLPGAACASPGRGPRRVGPSCTLHACAGRQRCYPQAFRCGLGPRSTGVFSALLEGLPGLRCSESASPPGSRSNEAGDEADAEHSSPTPTDTDRNEKQPPATRRTPPPSSGTGGTCRSSARHIG
jgi:hypothetical protein